MEPITIILGVALIFMGALAADQYTDKEKFAEQSKRNKNLADLNMKEISRLKPFTPPERKPYERPPLTWIEQHEYIKDLEQKYKDARESLYRMAWGSTPTNRHFMTLGQKPAEVIKIELGDDFKELKAAVDSLGSVQILKTELDRAHKREAVYMKRLLVSNAAILAASKKS